MHSVFCSNRRTWNTSLCSRRQRFWMKALPSLSNASEPSIRSSRGISLMGLSRLISHADHAHPRACPCGDGLQPALNKSGLPLPI